MADFRIIDSKGRVIVPLRVRKRLSLRVGDRIEFVVRGKGSLICPARRAGNPFEKYVGALSGFPGGIPEINAWVCYMRDAE